MDNVLFWENHKKVYWSDKQEGQFSRGCQFGINESAEGGKQKQLLRQQKNQVNQWKPGRKWMMLTLFIMLFPFPSCKVSVYML